MKPPKPWPPPKPSYLQQPDSISLPTKVIAKQMAENFGKSINDLLPPKEYTDLPSFAGIPVVESPYVEDGKVYLVGDTAYASNINSINSNNEQITLESVDKMLDEFEKKLPKQSNQVKHLFSVEKSVSIGLMSADEARELLGLQKKCPVCNSLDIEVGKSVMKGKIWCGNCQKVISLDGKMKQQFDDSILDNSRSVTPSEQP